jgi:colanic acid biosynthesis glycosyl transferase WcaI
MKVLLTHRFFWPDTAPYAIMLRVIAKELVQAGHDVHVLASIPSYRESGLACPRQEVVDGAKLRRVWVLPREKSSPTRRGFNVVIYSWHLCVEILRLRPDVVTASTFPPVIAAWCASLAARLVGAKFVYHMQDIHPEISKISKGLLGRHFPAMVLRWFDNQTLRRSAAVIALSNDMVQTLNGRGISDLPVHVINNFSLSHAQTATGDKLPATLRKDPLRKRVIFAGNLGRFQNLMLLTEGVAQLFQKHPDLDMLLLGDGSALPELQARWAKTPQVQFAPFIPFEQAQAVIADADIGLVSLSAGIYRAAYPSKVLTYLELGVPVFALVEPESNLAQSLIQAKVGAVPTELTVPSIAAALGDLLASKPAPRMVKAWHESQFGLSSTMQRWRRLFEDLRAGSEKVDHK